MSLNHLRLSAAVLLLAMTSCYGLNVEDRPCGANGECLEGFVCIARGDKRVCVAGSIVVPGTDGGSTGAGGGAAGGAAGGGSAGGAAGGASNDAGLQAPSQVLTATGRMSNGPLQVDIAVGEPIPSTTMSGGPWSVTTSVSQVRGP